MNNQKIKLNIFDRKYENEFHVINNTYKNFEEFLLKKGFLFTKGTNLGFWAGTPMKSMFEAFNILFEHDKLEKIAGRWMLAPNDMVRIFNMKYGTSEEQNEFVFFIDGNEETFNSEYKGVEEFRESWKRSKYTILLD